MAYIRYKYNTTYTTFAMIKKNLHCFAVSILLICILSSCHKSVKEEEVSVPPTTPPTTTPLNPQAEYVSAAVSGRVFDDQGKPVSGAVVKAGTASTTTDLNGSFIITNVPLNKQAALVMVEKNGFFQGSRTFIPISNSDNYVRIQLIKKALAGNFNGNTGGTITISNGGSIQFDAGSVINATTSTAYTGNVTVYAFFINPEANNFRDIMPGALLATNASNQQVALESFGMMAVELAGSSGEKLQLLKGKPATLTCPIPTSLQTSAPATIPLWYFNDTTGLWKEEGSAVKQGQTFVGKTSHFSFWNCDVPYPLVDFKAVIKGENGIPIVHANVVISGNVNGSSTLGNGVANADGVISGKIPANKSLQLSIYSPCGDFLQKQNIGPFSAATDLGTITVASYKEVPITLTGSLSNCAGVLINDGAVDVLLDGTYYRTAVTKGVFSIKVPRCKVTAGIAKITGVDYGTMQQSNEITQTVKDTLHNFGLIATCGASFERYIVLKFRNETITFLPPADTIYLKSDGGPFVQNAKNYTRNATLNFSYPSLMQLNPVEPFPVTSTFLNLYIDGIHFQQTGYTIYIKENGSVNYVSPKYVAGYFSITVNNLNTGGPQVPLSCSFRALNAFY
jgi:hypothetical protein